MSFLKKSLEKRILELRKSIEAQATELAAYEQVLALESGKPLPALQSVPASVAAVVKVPTHPAPAKKKTPPPRPAAAPAGSIDVAFNGSRSDFVAAILKQRGSAGVTPLEISKEFASRKISVGKNLVYNVLSLLFKQKKVRKSDGKYYLLATASTPKSLPAAVPAAANKKRRISEEGMRRIIAATKKYQAAKRAAKAKQS